MKTENYILNLSEFIPHWFEDVQKRGASKIISLKLFSRYSSFFDEFIINEFSRKQKADTSHKGHKALMLEIEAYVTENIKIESREDYANLVDTLKNLAEKDD